MNETDSPLRANPVFWLMWLLPGSAVVGGLTTLFISLRNADPVLPPEYHVEGQHLDRDFALARNAAAHGIEASFSAAPVAGECALTLRSAPGDPTSLTMLFTSGNDPGLDRAVYLQRIEPGQYRGHCAPIPAGRWRVSLEDAAGEWSIRAQVVGEVGRLSLRARNPDGPG